VKRLRVGVLYGGRSGEHEVSLASAASVFANMDRTRYEPVAIRIEKDGRWALADRPPATMSAAEVIEHARLEAARPSRTGREVHFMARPSEETILSIDRRSSRGEDGQALVTGLNLDVIFPVLHGPYGEDGTIQGLLELANVPYVGAGVLASAVGMDKGMMKVVFAAAGLPVCPYCAVLRHDWQSNRDAVAADLEKALHYPMFVKPANLGSSVGISKAKNRDGLIDAMDLAGSFDRRIVVEAAVPNAREIECAVLGNDNPEASVAGEIVPSAEFYDYSAKYLDEGSQLIIPAKLGKSEMKNVQRLAIAAFRAVDCSGLSRVDFLMDPKSRKIYLNEINTMPGFTSISMYPKLWAASGVSYPELIERLIQLGRERHADKKRNQYSR
jgi:D-alanine-D-alanine ligase